MNKEDYVSLEVAKLLKEKGFMEDASYCFDNDGELHFNRIKINHNQHSEVYSAPSLYEAAKWMRERWGINISADRNVRVCKWFYRRCNIHCGFKHLSDSCYKTYEDALNAGILEALKRI